MGNKLLTFITGILFSLTLSGCITGVGTLPTADDFNKNTEDSEDIEDNQNTGEQLPPTSIIPKVKMDTVFASGADICNATVRFYFSDDPDSKWVLDYESISPLPLAGSDGWHCVYGGPPFAGIQAPEGIDPAGGVGYEIVALGARQDDPLPPAIVDSGSCELSSRLQDGVVNYVYFSQYFANCNVSTSPQMEYPN